MPSPLAPMSQCSPAAASSIAYSSVYMRAVVLNPSKSPLLTRFPASQLSGLDASAAPNSVMIARQTVLRVQPGVQSDLRISKHISPVCAYAREVSGQVKQP
eukprot:TRINITY_DN9698_c0_g1_i1.p1 TRINITY_DN9698_c0_g1~~TRINITY_DN9698_c0_g1_i1.p1  ORF type:complete len:101 (-),score=9.12 TRINITY_DN9698_c0_g1_i1:434-736(-)